MAEIFEYVVARHWNDDSKCIYSYHSEIQKGTIEDAKLFLKYVKQQSPAKEQDYKIYKINYEEISS